MRRLPPSPLSRKTRNRFSRKYSSLGHTASATKRLSSCSGRTRNELNEGEAYPDFRENQTEISESGTDVPRNVRSRTSPQRAPLLWRLLLRGSAERPSFRVKAVDFARSRRFHRQQPRMPVHSPSRAY